MPRPVIIDTDPGVDDTVALLLAAHDPALAIRAVTSVGGNVVARRTQENARGILELAGRSDVPVYAGADRPLKRTDLVTAEYAHGESGIMGLHLPAPRRPAGTEHAADAIIRAAHAAGPADAAGGGLAIVALGPLTNIALAMQKDPSIIPNIADIAVMGGAVGDLRATIPDETRRPPHELTGNITDHAEFNFHVDPDAAAYVLDRARRVTLFPLDVTHRTVIGPAQRDALRSIDEPVGANLARMLDEAAAIYPGFGGSHAPLHDPNPVVYLSQPQLYAGQAGRVAVEVAGGEPGTRSDRRGHCTFAPAADGAADGNVMVMTSVDAEGYFAAIHAGVERTARRAAAYRAGTPAAAPPAMEPQPSPQIGARRSAHL